MEDNFDSNEPSWNQIEIPITQGETVARLWEAISLKINFAYKSFIWDSEANVKAHVHCVIIGFADFDKNEKWIYSDSVKKKVENINGYLIDAPNLIIESRNKPLCNIPNMIYGNIPRDGGFYTFTTDEKDLFLKQEPTAEKYIFKMIGGNEFINNIERWIMFLRDCPPNELKSMKRVLERVNSVKEFRLSSKAKEIQKFALTPTLFAQQTQPIGKDYIAVPIVSSEKRRYIPIGFVKGNILTNNQIQIIPDASIYHFGILTSNVHNAGMRAACGRLEMRYRYSKDVVYNNFPWCNPTDEQKAKIEQTAQAILDARAKYPECSLADLYDETVMPPELRKAHQENDKAVMSAYGFSIKMTESECVAELFKLYEKLTK